MYAIIGRNVNSLVKNVKLFDVKWKPEMSGFELTLNNIINYKSVQKRRDELKKIGWDLKAKQNCKVMRTHYFYCCKCIHYSIYQCNFSNVVFLQVYIFLYAGWPDWSFKEAINWACKVLRECSYWPRGYDKPSDAQSARVSETVQWTYWSWSDTTQQFHLYKIVSIVNDSIVYVQ